MQRLDVLVIEDSLNDYELIVHELRRGGYAPAAERVQTADELRAALQRRPWDIAFSDWFMPSFRAPEALQIVGETAPDLPFIIVSGSIDEEAAVEALRRGAHDFLSKNRLARLLPAVSRALRETRLRSERRAMQQQLLIAERMASIGTLAASVAHEINNPLAAALTNVDLALEQVQRLKRRRTSTALLQLHEELSDIRDAAGRIRDIVCDLKVFSRGDEEEQRQLVDVRRILDSSLRIAGNEVRHRARLVKAYVPVEPIAANESRLGQVFLNLIVNAAQAIGEGEAENNEIRIALRPLPGGGAEIEISDTGCGMTPEIQGRLFTPFFTTKPIGAGTGLGLAICHRIVSGLGGQISVHSAPGKGSTFTVRLPASEPSSLPHVSSPAPAPAPSRRGRVMVVDDDPLVAKAIGRALGMQHDVVSVHRAREVLFAVVKGERFDVIISDLMMPEMTGMELYGRLRCLQPDQARRMVFLTGGAFTSQSRAFLAETGNVCLDKPFDSERLRQIVNQNVA